MLHDRVMSRCGPLPTVGHMTDPAEQGRETVMLPGGWTAELGRQRMAELHRLAEQQRLIRLARAQRRGDPSGVSVGRGWRWRWLAGWRRGSGAGVMESSTAPSAAGPSATP